MMELGLDLSPIVARLADEVPALALIGGAVEYEQAIAGLSAAVYPAAFVLPARDEAGENAFGNQLVQQEVSGEFAVLIGAQNLNDHEGIGAHEALRPLRSAIARALLNWQPADEADGCEYRRGAFFAFEGSTLWWSDTYSTRYIIRST